MTEIRQSSNLELMLAAGWTLINNQHGYDFSDEPKLEKHQTPYGRPTNGHPHG